MASLGYKCLGADLKEISSVIPTKAGMVVISVGAVVR